jgi:DNA polymerase-4
MTCDLQQIPSNAYTGDAPGFGDAPVLHVDVDAFFASVEQVLDPSLAGRPVVVGGGIDGRGVVASASYEARRYGLTAGMPIYRARELCPGAAYLPPRHEVYNGFSGRVFDALAAISPSVQQTSLDEASVSLRGCDRLYGPLALAPAGRLPFAHVGAGVYCRRAAGPDPEDYAEVLPEPCRWAAAVAVRAGDLLHQRTGLSVSMGVAANALVARVASTFAKPQGLTVVPAGRESDFIAMLDLADIPGIGRAVLEKFRKWNVRTVESARLLPADLLEDAFGGERGRAVHGLLRGTDRFWDGPWGADPQKPIAGGRTDLPRNVTRETTFWTASSDHEFVEGMLFYLTERLGRAVRRLGLEGRTVQVKLRYQDMVTTQCSRSLGRYTDSDEEVFGAARRLLRMRWCRSRRVRLVGVGLTDLRRARAFQCRLFDETADRSRRLDRCLDGLRERFGFGVVQRGPAIALTRQ